MTLHPDPRLDALLGRFARAVRESGHNLVSTRARDELETRHVPECVAFADLLPRDIKVLDVGSGGGFPGLVVAIVRPDLEVHLLDATAKKTDFLRGVAEDLEVPVTVHTGRAEDLARDPALREAFDVVTARAVAPLHRLVDWVRPFLAERGLLYAIKGERWVDELDAASTAMTRAGMHVVATPDDHLTPGCGQPDGVQPRVVMLARTS